MGRAGWSRARAVSVGLVMGVALLLAAPASGVGVTPLADLGTLGGLSSLSGGINDLGQIAGTSSGFGGVQEAFVVDAAGSMRSIGSLCGEEVPPICTPNAMAYDINDAGQVTGGSNGDFSVIHAFRYEPSTDSMNDLGTLGGEFAWGYGIDDSGTVVGGSFASIFPSGPIRAFVARPGEPMADLGTLRDPISANAQANDINAHGIVVGSSNYGDDPNLWHPVLWDLDTGAITDLGALGFSNGYGEAISDTGLVTGSLSTPTGAVAFLYDTTTATMRELPLPPGLQNAGGVDVNDDGVVLMGAIETLSPGTFAQHMFVYDSRTGDLVEVPPIAGRNVAPAAINDLGVVAASSSYDSESVYLHAARAHIQIAPDAPTALTATGCGAAATLSWSAPVSDGYADTLRYEVRRDGVTIATVEATTFTDVAAPATATYEVLAVNDGGTSAAASVTWQGSACPNSTTTTTSTARPASAASPVAAQPRFTG